MLRFRRLIVAVCGAALVTAGAVWTLSGDGFGASRAPKPHAPSDGARAPEYSPFVVRLDREGDNVPFDTISFKDVGMSVPASTRSYVYESIAQSLSHELSSHPARPLASRVTYSEEVVDPSWHLHCESGHIYVDIWQDASNDTWGYSLWSSCGESGRFAHEQLEVAGNDSLSSVQPLTREIASSLHHAIETNCFSRRC